MKYHRQRKDFANSKNQCLGKRDKSSAGRIDPRAVDICASINALEAYYTTSSCAGRCFLYRGFGNKTSEDFVRFRVSHESIIDPQRYFDLTTLESDPTGGGDPIREIGQYDYQASSLSSPEAKPPVSETTSDLPSIWLRFEPFILHVACRSAAAARRLMAEARPWFKNVALTTWNDARYLVAVWGDEGLDMPLMTRSGEDLVPRLTCEWLAELVNERHERNWSKIESFVGAVRSSLELQTDDLMDDDTLLPDRGASLPKSYDVIGDVALLHSLPHESDAKLVGEAILRKNKAIKVVVLRRNNLDGSERAPGMSGLEIVAGIERSPLITTHVEYGIKCVVDLNHTFFSPRMASERLRICQQVARGEHVLVLFAGVAMDAFQIAGRTEASTVTAIELNETAVECARRAHTMLERNKAVKCAGPAERLHIIQGNVLEILPTLPKNYYDRILVPRPKEGAMDGDLGTGDSGAAFLEALLPVLKHEGGECHWYDFCADHEYPNCERTRALLTRVCGNHGLTVHVLHTANAGSVATRQLRICIDFRVTPNR